MAFPLVFVVSFVLAATIALAVGLSSAFADLVLWGLAVIVLAVMSYSGHREKRRLREAEQQLVRWLSGYTLPEFPKLLKTIAFETRLKSLLRKPVVALLKLAKTQRLLEQSLNNVIESLHDVVVGTKSPVRAGKFRLDCAPVLGSYLMSSPITKWKTGFSRFGSFLSRY